MEEDNSRIAFAIIGVIIILAFILALTKGLSYITSRNNDPKKEDIDYSLTLSAIDSKGYVSGIKYQFFEEGSMIAEGTLKNDVIERIDNLEKDKQYRFLIQDDRYYESETVCLFNQSSCVANLDRYPKVNVTLIRFEEDYIHALIYVNDGIIRMPFFCIGENSQRVKKAWIEQDDGELLRLPVPNRMKLYYDTCYHQYTEKQIIKSMRQNISSQYEYDIKKYNRKYKTNYESFENITFTEPEIQNYPLQDFKDGLYQYRIKLELDTDHAYSSKDLIRLAVVDQYGMSQLSDTGVKDKISQIMLKI